MGRTLTVVRAAESRRQKVLKTSPDDVGVYLKKSHPGTTKGRWTSSNSTEGDLRMKTLLRLGASVAFAVTTGAVCSGLHYTQTNLVSNADGAARVTDRQLINPWGMSRGPSSAWWVSDQRTGFSLAA